MPQASRIGTMDPMGHARVYVNELLEEVPAGSPDAAFVYKRTEIEALRARRHELELDKGDEALRVTLASRKLEREKVERRLAILQAERDELVDEGKAEKKSAAKK